MGPGPSFGQIFKRKLPSFDSQLDVVYKPPWVTVPTVMSVKREHGFFYEEKTNSGQKLTNHTWYRDRVINNTSIIDKANCLIRKFLNAWHTMTIPNADNNSCPLPGQYSILFTKKKFCSCIFLLHDI